MNLVIHFVRNGACFPPTDRSPQHGPHGKHFDPYTDADLYAIESGSNPVLEHSKMRIDVTAFDPGGRGTGPRGEITREDVARLGLADKVRYYQSIDGGPETDITEYGKAASIASAGFDQRLDVTGVGNITYRAELEGVDIKMHIRSKTPPYPTTKE